VVSPEEWLAARKDLLVKEKEATRARDRVNADRRRLPMVRIDEPIDRALRARTWSPVSRFTGHARSRHASQTLRRGLEGVVAAPSTFLFTKLLEGKFCEVRLEIERIPPALEAPSDTDSPSKAADRPEPGDDQQRKGGDVGMDQENATSPRPWWRRWFGA
jgi:hypothetical protein